MAGRYNPYSNVSIRFAVSLKLTNLPPPAIGQSSPEYTTDLLSNRAIDFVNLSFCFGRHNMPKIKSDLGFGKQIPMKAVKEAEFEEVADYWFAL